MEGFILSFQPFFSRFRAEIILLAIAALIAIASTALFYLQTKQTIQSPITQEVSQEQNHNKMRIFVEVSGAVKHPGVYTFNPFSRFNDAVQQAGGLTEEADKAYVERNFNLARILTDQEKIYVPFLSDTLNGIIFENKHTIDYTAPAIVLTQENTQGTAKIDINLATLDELDTLTGIGKVQADAIIKSRPYANIEELISKSVLRTSVFEKIKNDITAL